MNAFVFFIVYEKVGIYRKQGQGGAGEEETEEDQMWEETEEDKQMWEEITKWSRSIEVIYQRHELKPLLTRIYFQLDPQVGLNLCHCHTYQKIMIVL